MHKTAGEGVAFVQALAARIGSVDDREVMVAPPFTGLAAAVTAARGTAIGVAAQDVFWNKEGAYTGEVAPGMLADLGVKAVIVGHSERRQLFGETDEWVSRKVRAALDGGLSPLVCVGESAAERERGFTNEVLARQIVSALSAVRSGESALLTIAYEPIWAIGTGQTATALVAQEAAAFCRTRVEDSVGRAGGTRIRVLYGGSVRPDNIDELMAQPDIDGVLVGGASLDLEAFCRIVGFDTR
jgi:triosephosphate isomerase